MKVKKVGKFVAVLSPHLAILTANDKQTTALSILIVPKLYKNNTGKYITQV
jgi:hypothetical protein